MVKLLKVLYNWSSQIFRPQVVVSKSCMYFYIVVAIYAFEVFSIKKCIETFCQVLEKRLNTIQSNDAQRAS